MCCLKSSSARRYDVVKFYLRNGYEIERYITYKEAQTAFLEAVKNPAVAHVEMQERKLLCSYTWKNDETDE